MAPSAMRSSTINITNDVQPNYVDTDDLRTAFALAMSAMYKKEVPLYGDLIRIVRTTNEDTLSSSSSPRITALRSGDVDRERLDLERHGAIRLGTPYELRTVRRIFTIIGLHPVGYYDLSPAGLPMHATCFRPITTLELKKNPFRVFTTLLRPELLRDVEMREIALDLLARRQIFSRELLDLLDNVENVQNGRVTETQGEIFIREAMKTFGWKPVAASSQEVYQKLKTEHPILADIACFQSSHINHLTPRTLDISAAQDRMKAGGLAVKDRIEGPPARHCPILLRQTSFLALEEPILFPSRDSTMTEGYHKARFGEIEERGAAVTREGRRLYDRLLEKAMKMMIEVTGAGPKEHDRILSTTFLQYPDTWEELCRRRLVYFTFRCADIARAIKLPEKATRDELFSRGLLQAIPITYEDFLPLSAAGIFQSNLQSGSVKTSNSGITAAIPDKSGYANALECSLLDPDSLYKDAQTTSLKLCALELGLEEEALLV